MVPKRMEASWAALLPPGLSSSESSSSESLSEPQSSSSGLFLETGPEGTAGGGAGGAVWVMRKKGFVDSAGAAGAAGGCSAGVAKAGVDASEV